MNDIGSLLGQKEDQKYLGGKVADWDLALTPRPGHADRRLTVATPLEHAGVYLVTAKLADGNTSRTVVWLEDLAIVRKPLATGMFYYVADAVTGQPIVKAKLEFFGYRQVPIAPRR